MTGEELANSGVNAVDQLQFISPGATVNNFGQGIDFNIRGIGKAEHNTQTTTGVITYRDGVATFPGYFTAEPYYDIAPRRDSARSAGHCSSAPERHGRRGVRHLAGSGHRRAAQPVTCRARSADYGGYGAQGAVESAGQRHVRSARRVQRRSARQLLSTSPVRYTGDDGVKHGQRSLRLPLGSPSENLSVLAARPI